MKDILKKIVENKLTWIKYYKKKLPLATFQKKIIQSNYNFKQSLKSIHPAFILEIKKASPSSGIINQTLNIQSITKIYNKYASSISVLTDEQYFHGKFEYISEVRNYSVNKPILCKDFFIDAYQIYFSRYHQANAILLILSILNDNQYTYLSNVAKTLNMDVLTEIENENELNRALRLNAEIIGINNRNLHDFSIDINKTQRLASLIPKNVVIISESGIKSYKQIRKLQPFVQGFLIGSHLMKQKDLETAICKIFMGHNKICGLTRSIDAKISKKSGAIYGGLIFCKFSPRYIECNHAYSLIKNINTLRYIGVFCNENLKKIVYIVETLKLYAVQLHGNEDQIYINKLRNMLPENVKIWKAITFSHRMNNTNYTFFNVDKYIFDNTKGGSGKSFDWSYLKNIQLNHVILAGGLNNKNCILASNLGCFGLDFNSGLEYSPGIKNLKKIFSLFNSLRTHTTTPINSINTNSGNNRK